MSTVGPFPGRAPAALLATVGATLACANEQPPPGALPDHEPPRIESIEPAPDSVVPGFEGKVRIRFDEPVRVERGSFGQQLIASPMEAYSVETGFSDVRLSPRDGWRDSVVYCLEIPAGIRDVLSNQTRQGTEFCFSTGVPIIDSRITGTVLDAVTGLPTPGASVLFLAEPDSVPYGALTDQDGRFRLRALPPGTYSAFGFRDQNRNFRLDRALEPHDSSTVTSFEGAQPDLLFSLVEPDTTPPRALRADAPDSMTVRIEFDDPLLRPQPGSPTIAIADSATGAPVAVFGFRVGEPSEVSFPNDPAATPDTAVVADTAAAPPAVPPPAPPPPVAPAAGDSTVARDSTAAPPALPSRFVTVRVTTGIRPGTYRLRAEGFVNLRRLSGGGDTTFVVAADTTAAPPDTAGASRDSLGVAPDTVTVADSASVRGDTLAAVRRWRSFP